MLTLAEYECWSENDWVSFPVESEKLKICLSALGIYRFILSNVRTKHIKTVYCNKYSPVATLITSWWKTFWECLLEVKILSPLFQVEWESWHFMRKWKLIEVYYKLRISFLVTFLLLIYFSLNYDCKFLIRLFRGCSLWRNMNLEVKMNECQFPVESKS